MPDSNMRTQKLLWMIAVIITVAVMIAIICFSAQSGEESNGISRALGEKLMRLFPALRDRFTAGEWNYFLRKLAHFTLYFILGCGLTGTASRQRRISPVLIAIVGGTFFAATDELHQFFSNGRQPLVWDVLLDACGVATGSAFAMLCKSCLRKRKIAS